MPGESKWIEPQEHESSAVFQSAIGGHALVSTILQRRGIQNVDVARAFIDPALYQPTGPEEIPNLLEAVLRLETAISARERMPTHPAASSSARGIPPTRLQIWARWRSSSPRDVTNPG